MFVQCKGIIMCSVPCLSTSKVTTKLTAIKTFSELYYYAKLTCMCKNIILFFKL